jgi:hypothetical protein
MLYFTMDRKENIKKGDKVKKEKAKFYDFTGNIIAYESGELSSNDTLVLFSELVKNGMAWSLQGCYGRTARALIESGYISNSGEILKEFDEVAE